MTVIASSSLTILVRIWEVIVIEIESVITMTTAHLYQINIKRIPTVIIDEMRVSQLDRATMVN